MRGHLAKYGILVLFGLWLGTKLKGAKLTTSTAEERATVVQQTVVDEPAVPDVANDSVPFANASPSKTTEASFPTTTTIHNNITASATSLLAEYYIDKADAIPGPTYQPFRDDFFTARYSEDSQQWETEPFEESFQGRNYKIKAPNASEPTHGVLGFIRIQKTGSTTILSKLLPRETGPLYKCFRGHIDGSDFPQDLYAKHIQCQHLSFVHLFNRWKDEILPAVHNYLPPEEEGMSYTLQIFTIIRDPFDRVLSLFKYMRKRPTWHAMTTDEHIGFLRQGDIWNWTESMYKRPPSPERYGIPLEANYFTQSASDLSRIDHAIPLVQGQYPRILALINECFDASVLLLRERFPRFIREEDVLEFLKLSQKHQKLNHKDENLLEIEKDANSAKKMADTADNKLEESEASVIASERCDLA